ncbi:MAG: hypothetical protein K6E55_09245 [Thermoguttaceae bacterium]|nr:hypothetical protein [Thermoguttaceae bacterium]
MGFLPRESVESRSENIDSQEKNQKTKKRVTIDQERGGRSSEIQFNECSPSAQKEEKEHNRQRNSERAAKMKDLSDECDQLFSDQDIPLYNFSPFQAHDEDHSVSTDLMSPQCPFFSCDSFRQSSAIRSASKFQRQTVASV